MFEDSETFAETITVPFLEFQVRSTIAFEPLSGEWLQIQTNAGFLRAGVKTVLGLMMDILRSMKYSPLLIHESVRTDFEGRNFDDAASVWRIFRGMVLASLWLSFLTLW
jgi:hypothetical protein